MRLSFETQTAGENYEAEYRKWQKEALALQQDKQKIAMLTGKRSVVKMPMTSIMKIKMQCLAWS